MYFKNSSRDVYLDPVILVACGHSFCRRCVETIQAGRHKVCPLCRSRDLTNARNLVLDEVCRCLHVTCPARGQAGSAGGGRCHWQGQRQDLAAHQAQCPYGVVECPNIGIM